MIGGSTSPHAVGAVRTYTHITPTTVPGEGPASGAHLPAGTRSTEQFEVAQPGRGRAGTGTQRSSRQSRVLTTMPRRTSASRGAAVPP